MVSVASVTSRLSPPSDTVYSKYPQGQTVIELPVNKVHLKVFEVVMCMRGIFLFSLTDLIVAGKCVFLIQ